MTRPTKAASATEAAICAAWADGLPAKPDLPSRSDTKPTQDVIWQLRVAIDLSVKVQAAACVGPQ